MVSQHGEPIAKVFAGVLRKDNIVNAAAVVGVERRIEALAGESAFGTPCCNALLVAALFGLGMPLFRLVGDVFHVVYRRCRYGELMRSMLLALERDKTFEPLISRDINDNS